MFCLPITILLNHLTAALAPKALLNKPLPCKAGRHREPRDVDNQCCVAPVGQLPVCKAYTGRERMRDLGALGLERVFCLSMVDAAGFGAGVCQGPFTRAPVSPYSPALQCLGDVGLCRCS